MIRIFGYGVTTKPLVRFLNSLGIRVAIYDDTFEGTRSDEFGNTLLDSALFSDDGAPTPIVNLTQDSLQTCDISIISPGIPPTHMLVHKARNLIGEYDFFYFLLQHWQIPPKSVWISGTNGKTTTTQMTTTLLESFGAKSGGNIGTPLSELYVSHTPLWILETSSFSLHYATHATPDVYALLPVREDHITWHGSFEAYVADKLSVLGRMREDTSAILPFELAEHPVSRAFKGRAYFYKDSQDLASQLGIEITSVHIKEPFLLDGLIALGIAKILYGVCDIEALNAFKIGAHRIEEFRDSQNYLWVDDSKGTNVDATIEAVRRYQDKHIWLILGGDDKGADLRPLFRFMQGKSISIFAIGSNASRLLELSMEYGISCEVCNTLDVAVEAIKKARYAKDSYKECDVALLSPAAASLDQFSSYKERGDVFKQYALTLR
ncbi:UDP-N-acetylmuramoyl-L-alanine--D-glutamate ligase [Helicobacter sp. TUL]|uniref:UDP-N-acetylmuramoyl-L-alanine--D-glutamate ligase n=1 Tax=Helicobacter sp. TUL TaxID=1848928 RepID=UPI000BAB5C5E|nr:UDP-N-acetylmuramoyl-L-alanine--D-glutamate ligase [Helicobacter sp. TUL]PAV00272.1 UDP-N-acetylmuramoyl-L-alanine--D-glutamate ligase [Helicobacter sp. TUL]